MNKNSGALLRDIRNMKKNNTITLSMTSKDLMSSKDINKAKSSEQINLHKLSDVKTHSYQNKNEKIRNIDEKLELHQSEI